MTHRIIPTILCGGMGSRLWPMSRVDQPKQFQSVNGAGSNTFFQETMLRHHVEGFGDPIVVTNAKQTAIVARQMRSIGMDATIVGEPIGRNTGPAVLAAALFALRKDPDALLLVLPSDHIITGDINRIIMSMADAADNGRIITFGVEPSYPETGYGYITDGGAFGNYAGLHHVSKFIEKPPLEDATALLDAGGSYWASGISMLRADLLVSEFARYDQGTLAAVSEAVAKAHFDELGASILEELAFVRSSNEPTERLIFERSDRISLAPLPGIKWDDVGAWNSVHSISEKAGNGNVTQGDVITHETSNSLIRSEDRLVAVIGLDDVIVIDTPDALLLASREHSQDVKKIVEQLKERKRVEVASHRRRDMPWGQIERLRDTGSYEMDMLSVEKGGKLKVNGTGRGLSILTAVSGNAECELPSGVKRLNAGVSVIIDPDYSMPLVNDGEEPFLLLHVTVPDLTTLAEQAAEVAKTAAEIEELGQIESKLDGMTADRAPDGSLSAA